MFEQWSDQLQAFVFENFVPASGEQVQVYLEGFLASVSKLTLPGMSVLILTALLLMVRIERAFNRKSEWDEAFFRSVTAGELNMEQSLKEMYSQ